MGIEKCFKIWGANSNLTYLEINRNHLVDYTSLFHDFFRSHDDVFNNKFQRQEIEDDKSIFRFNKHEFFETFLLNYETTELADFMEERLDMEDFQSESFVHQIRQSKDHIRLARLFYTGSGIILIPIGFSSEEMNSLIPKGYISKTAYSRYIVNEIKNKKNLESVSFPMHTKYKDKIKEQLKSNDPPIPIGYQKDSAPRLHDIDIIAKYGLPLENLKVVKNI